VLDSSAHLAGQVAIVTGGGRGIGSVVARALAGAGAAVTVTARSEDQLTGTARLIAKTGGRVLPVVADVTDAHAVARMVDMTEQQLGPVNLLVNNAGVNRADWPAVAGGSRRVVARSRSSSSRYFPVRPNSTGRDDSPPARPDHQHGRRGSRRAPSVPVELWLCQGGGGTADRHLGRGDTNAQRRGLRHPSRLGAYRHVRGASTVRSGTALGSAGTRGVRARSGFLPGAHAHRAQRVQEEDLYVLRFREEGQPPVAAVAIHPVP
jgi:hypothetical protein